MDRSATTHATPFVKRSPAFLSPGARPALPRSSPLVASPLITPTTRRGWLTTRVRAAPSSRRALPTACAEAAGATSGAAAAAAAAAADADAGTELPWESTIASDGTPLLFMPFLTHQREKMATSLPGLQREAVPAEFEYQRAEKRAARIASENFSSAHFRKIRLTYIDAGAAAQVFNSVWYPRATYDAPVLGIDFLSFGPRKVLCVMDFQPLTQDPAYLERYCARMEAVRGKYEGLKGRMSAKFYDEAQYFSKQLIFARYGEEGRERVADELFPAFGEYVDEYVRMVTGGECVADESEEAVARVTEWQREYDQYSAERDPAVGLFSSYWGKEWAENFTYNFLFSDAVVPEEPATLSA